MPYTLVNAAPIYTIEAQYGDAISPPNLARECDYACLSQAPLRHWVAFSRRMQSRI